MTGARKGVAVRTRTVGRYATKLDGERNQQQWTTRRAKPNRKKENEPESKLYYAREIMMFEILFGDEGIN